MPVFTTAAMIGGIVTYVGTQLAKNESLSGFFNDFTAETVNWIKPLFLKEDGTLQKEVEKLKNNPTDTKKQRVELILQDELEDNPNAEQYIKEIFEKISETDEGGKIVNNITNSKNVVTGNINAGGNINIGDKNTTTQNHSGNGDNIGGNKMINNNISGNDNITIQGIQSSEINLY
jgi:hypothetical protein